MPSQRRDFPDLQKRRWFIWKNEGVLIGTPTYETGLFPNVANILDIAKRKRIRGRKAGYFGWSGGAKREFEKYAEALNWEINNAFEFVGGSTSQDNQQMEEFKEFARKIKTD